MRTRIFVVAMVLAVALYGFMLISLGVVLLRGGSLIQALFGLGLLAIPGLGFLAVIREVRFGVESARLARTLSENDGVPLDTVARDEQGRIDPIAADIEWQRRKALVDQAPQDWRAWFLLGIAYDNARDRKQARAAIRRAIELFKADQS